jgi:bifunctional non-homologous end joining protein LigD
VASKRVEVSVGEHRLSLSNLDKLMYPRAGFTKGHVIDFYMRIAPVLLPHLEGRPLTLKRYPNGVEGGHFYEKRCPDHRPDWVRTAGVWSGRNEGEVNYCLCEDLATLVWLANLADLELHTPLHTAPDVETPRVVAFDLDPGPPATIVECARVALLLRAAFDHFGLRALAKTSGSKGMQVYVPLNTPGVTYAQTKGFAKAVAELLEAEAGDMVVARQTKTLRRGKVLVDWSQNDVNKTTVAPYSPRARERPSVSTPLTWEEVRGAVSAGDASGLLYDMAGVLARVAEQGDLFADALTVVQELPIG